MLLSIVVILSCLYTIFTKPVFLENQAINQRSRDQEDKSEGDNFQPEESINQENDGTSALDEFLDRPSAHNRTARNAHPCVKKIVRKYDSCRKSHVDEIVCLNTHIACSDAVPKYGKPLCKTVYGFNQLKFIHCTLLAIDCQCAA